jgi:hypothetical protein
MGLCCRLWGSCRITRCLLHVEACQLTSKAERGSDPHGASMPCHLYITACLDAVATRDRVSSCYDSSGHSGLPKVVKEAPLGGLGLLGGVAPAGGGTGV